MQFFGSKDFVWTYQARVFPYMEGDTHNIEKMGKGADAVYKKGKCLKQPDCCLSVFFCICSNQNTALCFLNFSSCCKCVFIALTEAAERFRELQAEKEMKQLQEDRKNDKKPPPYRHIRVQCVTTYTRFLTQTGSGLTVMPPSLALR